MPRSCAQLIRHFSAPTRIVASGLELGLDSKFYPGAMTIPVTAEGPALSVAALAETAGVGRDTIRYYERVGLLPEPPRTTGDHRRYHPRPVGGPRHRQLRLPAGGAAAASAAGQAG